MGISKTLTKNIKKLALAAVFLAASSGEALNSRERNHGLIIYSGKKAYDHGPGGILNLFREFRR